MASRMVVTRASNPFRSMLVDHGPGAPGHDRAGRPTSGRERAKRAHTGGASKGSTTAHVPAVSRAATSPVTSTRSVSRRPPTAATAPARTDARTRAGYEAGVLAVRWSSPHRIGRSAAEEGWRAAPV